METNFKTLTISQQLINSKTETFLDPVLITDLSLVLLLSVYFVYMFVTQTKTGRKVRKVAHQTRINQDVKHCTTRQAIPHKSGVHSIYSSISPATFSVGGVITNPSRALTAE